MKKNKKTSKKTEKEIVIQISIIIIFAAIILGVIFLRNKANPRNFENLEKGMAYEEVVKLLGQPDDTIKQLAGTQYYWFNGAKDINDANKKVEKSKKVYYIQVYVINEKVVSFTDGYWNDLKNSQE